MAGWGGVGVGERGAFGMLRGIARLLTVGLDGIWCGCGCAGVAGLFGVGMARGRDDVWFDGCADGGVVWGGCGAGGGATAGVRSV